MDYSLSDEHHHLRSTLRSFLGQAAPTAVVAEYDRAERFPQEIYDRLAR
jgi:hypothetical protein